MAKFVSFHNSSLFYFRGKAAPEISLFFTVSGDDAIDHFPGRAFGSLIAPEGWADN
jgi:hypothetical protein